MRADFYIVDEAKLPSAAAEGTAAGTPGAIIADIRRHGVLWREEPAEIEEFLATFKALDPFTGGGDFIVDLAFAGSPHLLLAKQPGPWRLGYFEESLVPHLNAVFEQLDGEIGKAIASVGPVATNLYQSLRSAFEEAASRKAAVAILHN